MKHFFTILFLVTSISHSIQSQNLNLEIDTVSSEFDILRVPYEDGLQNLYIPSYSGNIYLKEGDSYTTRHIKDEGRLWGAVVDQDNLIWTCGETGLFSYDFTTINEYNSTNSDLPYTDIRNIKIDSEGQIWMAAWNKGIIVKNEDTYKVIDKNNSPLTSNFVDNIEFLNDGRTLLTRSAKMFIIDNQDNWETIDLGPLLSFGTDIHDIYIENDNLILATAKGIKNYNLTNNEATDLSQNYGGEIELNSLIKDNNGGIWAFEDWEGLHYFSSNGDSYFFNYLDYNLPSSNVTLFKHDNKYWLNGGTGGQGAVNYKLSIPGVTTSTRDIIETVFTFYPNPAHGSIVVNFPKPIKQINLYSVEGELLLQSKSRKVNLTSISQGKYVLEVVPFEGLKINKEILIKL